MNKFEAKIKPMMNKTQAAIGCGQNFELEIYSCVRHLSLIWRWLKITTKSVVDVAAAATLAACCTLFGSDYDHSGGGGGGGGGVCVCVCASGIEM